MIAKRAFDVLVAAIGLVALGPVLLALVAWIKMDSKGPVLFRQERVGRHGRPFRIRKFRTMVADAEARGLQLTVDRDPRITRAGAFLRRHKLDELPQLIDVLVGHMSFVGPRPEVPKYVACYPESIRHIVLSVRPGITDPASLDFRNESEMLAASTDPEATYVSEILPIKLAYYRRYVEERTFGGDVRLIVHTVVSLLAPPRRSGSGARCAPISGADGETLPGEPRPENRGERNQDPDYPRGSASEPVGRQTDIA